MEPAPIRNIVPHKRIPRRKKEASNIFPSIAEFELSAIFSHYRRPLARRNIIPSSQKLKGNSSLNRRLRIDIPSLIPRSNEANFFFPPPFRGEERKGGKTLEPGTVYYILAEGVRINWTSRGSLSRRARVTRRWFSV